MQLHNDIPDVCMSTLLCLLGSTALVFFLVCLEIFFKYILPISAPIFSYDLRITDQHKDFFTTLIILCLFELYLNKVHTYMPLADHYKNIALYLMFRLEWNWSNIIGPSLTSLLGDSRAIYVFSVSNKHKF